MNKEELDNYLVTIGGLKMYRRYGDELMVITDANYFEISSGWYRLVYDLIVDLVDLGWDKEVVQVKEKFGQLRFYIENYTPEIIDRIRKAESDSYNICEVTGQFGELRRDIGWWRTLCEEEYIKLKK